MKPGPVPAGRPGRAHNARTRTALSEWPEEERTVGSSIIFGRRMDMLLFENGPSRLKAVYSCSIRLSHTRFQIPPWPELSITFTTTSLVLP